MAAPANQCIDDLHARKVHEMEVLDPANEARVPVQGCKGNLERDDSSGQTRSTENGAHGGVNTSDSHNGFSQNTRSDSTEDQLARPAPLDAASFRKPRGKNPTRHLYLANCGKGKGDTFDSVWATLRGSSAGAPVEALHVGEEGVSYASFSTPEVADEVRQALGTATNWIVRFADFPVSGPKTPESVESTAKIEVPGLILLEDFVTEEEAATLLAAIDQREWDSTIKRRVQHYGHAFDYARLKLAEEDGSLPALPPFAEALAARISERSPKPIDQLTVNEYEPGVGIASHCDAHSSFEDGICGLTLGSGIVMEFRKPRADSGGKVSVGRHHRLAPPPPSNEETEAIVQKNVWLPERSLFILTGEARYAWQHGIAWRKTDCISAREVIPRRRRVSMTFRAARFAPCQCQWPILCDAQNPEAHMLPSRITDERSSLAGSICGDGAESTSPQNSSSTVQQPS